jgi:hypothetical protein
MKQKVLFSIVFFILGLCIGGVAESARMSNKTMNNEQVIINNGRTSMIEFNIKFNKIYNNIGKLAIGQNNEYAIAIMQVLQQLAPELIKINKSLKLDCTEYQNGAPVSIQDENGNSSPLEKLPEEIRIMK